eukprot:732817-Hanusia_phi.AAC.2
MESRVVHGQTLHRFWRELPVDRPTALSARRKRGAESKVNENSMESKARLARDRARQAKNFGRPARLLPAHREARLEKEAQNRASKNRQRLFDDSFALAEREDAAGRQQSRLRASTLLLQRRRLRVT